jgi:hypothetical protein
MLNTMANQTKVKIATELLANLREREGKETFASLQWNVANLVVREASLRLGRQCQGDDDQKFFEMEDEIVKEAWRTIEFALGRVIS